MIFNNYEIKIIKKLQEYDIIRGCKIISKPFNTNTIIFLIIILYICKIIQIIDIIIIIFLALIVYYLKSIVHRKRPYQKSIYIINKSNINHGNEKIKLKNDSYSFPSGHATISLVLCFIIIKKIKKYSYLISLIPILVGFSRIYLGVHYPSDVICGFIIGSIYFSLISKYFKI
jgi:undecaprenyl-diphosphatase